MGITLPNINGGSLFFYVAYKIKNKMRKIVHTCSTLVTENLLRKLILKWLLFLNLSKRIPSSSLLFNKKKLLRQDDIKMENLFCFGFKIKIQIEEKYTCVFLFPPFLFLGILILWRRNTKKWQRKKNLARRIVACINSNERHTCNKTRRQH